MNAFILGTEALRIANQNSGLAHFDWVVLSETGERIRASNGMWVAADHALASAPRCDFLVLLEGNLPTQNISPVMLSAIRSSHRHGATIIGVDTGAFAIAAAGLTRDRELVIHWEAASSFMEQFPDTRLANALYLKDRQLAFCAGGVATLDLMLDLIASLRGQALAKEVANALIHVQRDSSSPQRAEDPQPNVAKPSITSEILRLMESNLDFPLAPKVLAKRLGLSVRTLERLCLKHFKQSPSQLYLRVRLQAARNFLFYEERGIQEIAVACGFSYPSVFTRAFSAQFGMSPRRFRQDFRERQVSTVRPEITRLSDARPKRSGDIK